MNKFTTRLMVIILCFAAGISVVAFWIYYQKSPPEQVILPNSRWEPIFFKFIDHVTEKAQIPALRQESLYPGNIEIRIWRGFGLSNLEGVIIKRNGSRWSASHLKADNYIDPVEMVDVVPLTEPKSGWESFWKQLNDKKLLELPDASEVNCEISMIDGTSYVVEINQNRIYRTFRYYLGVENCPEAKRMNEIGELIGIEFDTGLEQCRKDAWFACAVRRKKAGLITKPFFENPTF